jgi:hypothetical protein
VALTPAGRRKLDAVRLPPLDCLVTLLKGLPPAAMESADHVVRVLGARLVRYEKQMRRRGRPGP